MRASTEGFSEVGRRYYQRGYTAFPVEGKTAITPWKRFQRRQPYLHEVDAWERNFPSAGTAIAFGPGNNGLVGLDLDFDQPSEAATANEIADEILGRSPINRVGRWPRTMRLYRGRRVVNTNLGKVEILARGRYGVLHGVHPITQEPYRHVGTDYLFDIKPGDLPPITPNQIKTLQSELVAAGLIALHDGPNGARSGATGLTLREALAGVSIGQRHQAVSCVAYAYRGYGRSLEDALAAAETTARRCTPPYSGRKAAEVVHWAYSHLPPGQPSDTVPRILRVAHSRAVLAPFPAGAGSPRYRDFLALCQDLQRFRGARPIVLPQPQLAQLLGCSHQAVSKMIATAVLSGDLARETDHYEIGKKAKTYRWLGAGAPVRLH